MSIRIDQSIWINRPLDEVFTFVTDVSKMAICMPGMTAVKRVGDGAPGVGTQINFSYSMLGSTTEITAEWTAYEANKIYASKNVSGPQSEQLTTLEPENGGTRLQRVTKFKPEGFFGTLASPLIRRAVQRSTKTEFETIKDMLENFPEDA